MSRQHRLEQVCSLSTRAILVFHIAFRFAVHTRRTHVYQHQPFFVSSHYLYRVFSENAFDERMKQYKKYKMKIKKTEGTTVIFDWGGGDNVSEQFSEGTLRDLLQKSNLNVENIMDVGIAYICLISKQ